jgi:hypothetical protein
LRTKVILSEYCSGGGGAAGTAVPGTAVPGTVLGIVAVVVAAVHDESRHAADDDVTVLDADADDE